MDEKDNASQKKQKRSLFFRSFWKDGKGVDKSDEIKIDEYNSKNFFRLFARRIRYIVKINWLYIFGNFPIFALLLVISGNFHHAAIAPTSQFYPVLYGIKTISGASPALAPALGIHGIMGTATLFSWVDFVLLGVSALLIVTFGLVNTGCAYLMKTLVRGEHLFMWLDFKGAVKQNFRQGLILGVIDAAILGLSAYAISFYLANYNTYFILFYASIAMLAIYMFMRFYMYNLLVTFDLSIFKILKNSFIFAMIAPGKNFLALLIIIALIGISFLLSTLFLPIGIILFLIILVSACSYVYTYITYPKIKAVMIDPYYPNYGKEETEDEQNEDNA